LLDLLTPSALGFAHPDYDSVYVSKFFLIWVFQKLKKDLMYNHANSLIYSGD